MRQVLGDIRGLWKLRNGQYAFIDESKASPPESAHAVIQLVTRWYDGHILHPDGTISLSRCWDQYGNCIGSGNEYDLMERKRGNEAGWPEVKG